MTEQDPDNATNGAAPFAYDGLDRLIHERARLGILTSLMGQPEGLAFAELKRLCGLTDGNLSRHLQALEDAQLIEIEKRFSQKRPLTTCRVTAFGRERFLAYLGALEEALKNATTAASTAASKAAATAAPPSPSSSQSASSGPPAKAKLS